jgi:hypothetical protein
MFLERRESTRRIEQCGKVHRVGHHVLDARAVLGGVQGSTLRIDRACARPAGLDAACAQPVVSQLRDGRSCKASRIDAIGIDLNYLRRYPAGIVSVRY